MLALVLTAPQLLRRRQWCLSPQRQRQFWVTHTPPTVLDAPQCLESLLLGDWRSGFFRATGVRRAGVAIRAPHRFAKADSQAIGGTHRRNCIEIAATSRKSCFGEQRVATDAHEPRWASACTVVSNCGTPPPKTTSRPSAQALCTAHDRLRRVHPPDTRKNVRPYRQTWCLATTGQACAESKGTAIASMLIV